MFVMVAARMFGQQVFHPEHVAQERQLQLLREIEDEHKLKEARNRKKRRQKQAVQNKAERQAVPRAVAAAAALVEWKRKQRLREAESKTVTQDFLPPLMEEAAVTRWLKEGTDGATALPEDFIPRWREATLLLLPSYFSTPDLVTRTLPSRMRRNIARITVVRSLEYATSDLDYERVQKQVREEWLKVGGLLVGLAALETAAFALSPGSAFSIDKVARITVSGSSISTGAGLLCDIYLILRFSLASVTVFKHRTQDKYEVRGNGSINRTQSYLFFAVAARLPLLLAVVSIVFIAVLLAYAAYRISRLVMLAILGLTGIILYLEYICWVLIWMVFGLSKVLGWLVVGLSTAGKWPISAFKYVVGKTRALWRYSATRL
ncbi:hypothetical protein C8R44DRAFT_761389 [Mycena epipterygia]|nr:hypothetical protein C8R44DRAFT_761389 [Mycena epipterygia]